jgi:hypothetical protein
MTKGLWKCPPRELRLLIATLAEQPDGEPSRSWVARHEAQIEVLDPLTLAVAPDVAVRIVKRGGSVNLRGHNGDWNSQARALVRLAEVDKELARKVAAGNEPNFVSAVETIHSMNSSDDDITGYIRVLRHIDRRLLSSALKNTDATKASESWRQRLRDRKAKSRRQIAHLVIEASLCGGRMAEVAADLRRRLPERVLRDVEASIRKDQEVPSPIRQLEDDFEG